MIGYFVYFVSSLGALTNFSNASIKIEKHSASKKTPLTRAARTSARCQPYEYFELAEAFDNYVYEARR